MYIHYKRIIHLRNIINGEISLKIYIFWRNIPLKKYIHWRYIPLMNIFTGEIIKWKNISRNIFTWDIFHWRNITTWKIFQWENISTVKIFNVQISTGERQKFHKFGGKDSNAFMSKTAWVLSANLSQATVNRKIVQFVKKKTFLFCVRPAPPLISWFSVKVWDNAACASLWGDAPFYRLQARINLSSVLAEIEAGWHGNGGRKEGKQATLCGS